MVLIFSFEPFLRHLTNSIFWHYRPLEVCGADKKEREVRVADREKAENENEEPLDIKWTWQCNWTAVCHWRLRRKWVSAASLDHSHICQSKMNELTNQHSGCTAQHPRCRFANWFGTSQLIFSFQGTSWTVADQNAWKPEWTNHQCSDPCASKYSHWCIEPWWTRSWAEKSL